MHFSSFWFPSLVKYFLHLDSFNPSIVYMFLDHYQFYTYVFSRTIEPKCQLNYTSYACSLNDSLYCRPPCLGRNQEHMNYILRHKMLINTNPPYSSCLTNKKIYTFVSLKNVDNANKTVKQQNLVVYKKIYI